MITRQICAVSVLTLALGTAMTADAQATDGYWYYCASARAYYPSIRQCAEGWQRIATNPYSAGQTQLTPQLREQGQQLDAAEQDYNRQQAEIRRKNELETAEQERKQEERRNLLSMNWYKEKIKREAADPTGMMADVTSELHDAAITAAEAKLAVGCDLRDQDWLRTILEDTQATREHVLKLHEIQPDTENMDVVEVWLMNTENSVNMDCDDLRHSATLLSLDAIEVKDRVGF